MEEVNSLPAAMPVWLEVLGRHGDVASRQRVAGPLLTIGRAYDNDVVLDDPHVAAHHLRLARADDGTWAAEDLGSLNGLFVDGERTRRERVVLGGATALRVGHTVLRLRHASDSVPPELPLAQQRSPWPLAAVAVALVAALEVLGIWLGDIGEPKLIRYLAPALASITAIALWTTLWSVLSRVFGGNARFGLHLLIAGACLFAFSLYDQLVDLGAFALSWTALANTRYVAGWLVLALACFFHLRAISAKRLPLKGLALGVLAALGITTQTLRQSELRSTYGQGMTLQRLQPPSTRLVGTQDAEAFFAAAAALKGPLDEARSKEPEESADFDVGE